MYECFELFMANHCAPVLMGRKPAALFNEKSLPQSCAWSILEEQGLRRIRLRRRNQNSLVLFYHPELLCQALTHDLVYTTLAKLDYPVNKGSVAVLSYLRKRFYEPDEFPHEVGFFLGYPPEDVLGFMDCKGDCKLCGPWKVYSDVDRAVKLFNEHRRCKELLLELIGNGCSIFNENLSALAV